MSYFRDIEASIAGRRKIEAIKELRARTGLGLKDSKDAVDHFEAHGQWPPALRRAAGTETEAEAKDARDPGPTAPALREIEQHIARGNLILAIKELRAATSWGLKDSKEAVDAYRAHGAWPGRVLAAFEAGASQRPAVPAVPPVPRAEDPRAPMLQALADHLGHPADFQLSASAQRAGIRGVLVMLRDRACFVHDALGRWTVDAVISYGAVTHAEVQAGVRSTLYVSVGGIHHRFEMDPKEAEAALALLRVFAS